MGATGMKRGQWRLAIVSLGLSVGGSGDGLARLPADAEFRINGTTAASQRWPELAMDANGDFVVVWVDSALDGDSNGIRQRRFTSLGLPKGGGTAVNSHTTDGQDEPAVAADAQG